MLSQIREISGIDGSTLQNWTKRGWVANAHNKRYDKNQLARILIINMMRDSMQLERIAQLLTYVNGRAGDESDDIIPESELYDYLCRVIDVLVRDEMPSGADSLNDLIRETLANYEERTAGAAKRLEKACGIIIMAYYATLVRQKANRMLDDVFQK
jgi:DNA-binding transcriptional MerR regulator